MLLSKVVTWVVSASRTASQARAAELATSIQQESQVDVVAVVPVDVAVDVVADDDDDPWQAATTIGTNNPTTIALSRLNDLVVCFFGVGIMVE